jgi:hypothetical protein
MWTGLVGKPVYNLFFSDISGQRADSGVILTFSVPMGGHAVDNFLRKDVELQVGCGEPGAQCGSRRPEASNHTAAHGIGTLHPQDIPSPMRIFLRPRATSPHVHSAYYDYYL